ncbi:MAG: hypothetical protein QOD65_723 [Gaiellales bacterium]|jgi:signal transduction histidine kinase|nr:hypothetical protein [Gaiellales bacterium]
MAARVTEALPPRDTVPEPRIPEPGDEQAITDRLEERIARLEQRNLALERFAAMAAHQLAEPLVIAESSAILVAEELGDGLDAMLRARLDAIGRGAARARRLMDALLEDARSADRPPPVGPVDLGDIVANTLVSFVEQIEDRHAHVDVGALPRVRGEYRLLTVILDNLVANALKHGPRVEGVITIGAEPVGDAWRVSVASEGPPIPEADIPRIFAPFNRLPGERRISGTGLGLAICRRLVERLGGSFGLTPGAEQGNTFWFTLPAA